MGLEVWYPQDVRNILVALSSAGDLQGPEYHKALANVALAFGLVGEPVSILIDTRRFDNVDIEAHLSSLGVGSH